MTFMFFFFFLVTIYLILTILNGTGGSVDTFTDDIDELYLNCIRQMGVHPT